MAEDKSDDPFAPRDGTVYRPRPGAGRRSSEGAAAPATRHHAAPPPLRGDRAVPAAALRDFSAPGLNPLLQAASPVIVLMGRLRTSLGNPDVAALRRQALEQIREFEERARSGGVPHETVMAARYVLCGAIDEAVLSTPWGGQSEWSGQGLLVTLHREASSGEKFFDMLERIADDPERHIDLMELQYVCLALGFTGKYGVSDRGAARLAEVESSIYQRIRSYRGSSPEELSLHWQGMQDRRNPLVRYVPWWVIGAFSLVVISATFVYYHSRLSALAAPLNERLAHLGVREAPVTSAPSAAPRLHPLLRADEAAGVLSVEERGSQTVVTLTASDLFGSGSAVVNPKYLKALNDIALALNQVPGRVFVVGHTDDQPLRSLKFQDNYELSRARAAEVVKVLAQSIDSKARLEPRGVGDSEPRYTPASTAENRARNRRVEIIHVSGT